MSLMFLNVFSRRSILCDSSSDSLSCWNPVSLFNSKYATTASIATRRMMISHSIFGIVSCYNLSMISAKIREELTAAMKARDSVKMNTLRGLLTAFTNELVAKGIKPQEQISDEDALAVIKRAVKQRKDSIEQFRAGNREDLAQKEEAELKILETYMPAQMSREQIEVVAKQVKEKLGITDKSKMGQFVGAVMKELKGQADGAVVKEVVESILQ